MKETNRKLGVWCFSLLLVVVLLLVGKTIVKFYFSSSVVNVLIGVLIVAVLCLFFFMHKDDLKHFFKQLISVIAILVGLGALFKYVQDIELISALVSLTFGVWAIIWTLNARSVLSPGSSMRKYATSFFFCLLFVLIFSIWDAAINLLGLKGMLVYVRYIIMIFVYTTFVLASYKVYTIGKEFGFSAQSEKIKKVMKKKSSLNKKKGKLLRNYRK
tara:strand:+ start:47584 stop:48228 length:645 start_codon:yes stop_codon:yes gene_type:complete